MATIRIELQAPAELFAAPDIDPFAGRLEPEAGIERLLQGIDALRSRQEPVQLEIVLPNAALAGRSAADFRAPIAAFAAAEITAQQRGLAASRRQGRQALWIGVPVLAICLGLSTLATSQLGTAGLGNLVSNTLVIAGWVAMWRPAEILLYDWWPYRHRMALLRRLAAAPVSITAT